MAAFICFNQKKIPKMGFSRVQASAFVALLCMFCIPLVNGWGFGGHLITCRLAQPRLSKAATDAVSKLLPKYANNDLSSLCSWADSVRFRYRWSSPLHFVNTPGVCNYQYNRDCKDLDGNLGVCAVGAVNNYTSQLLNSASSSPRYNLTEALLFLSHFMGDLHQPLHVGFAADRGGNSIPVHWYKKKTNLHSVWDSSIIDTEEKDSFGSDVNQLINALQRNISTVWADQVTLWESCSKTTCPDIYASEGIKAACHWAYNGVEDDSVLGDAYYFSRVPIVNMRLAQGGVRLAKALNSIFG